MSLSRCLDLSNLRDFVHICREKSGLFFFTEVSNTLRVCLFHEEKLWYADLTMSQLTVLSSRLGLRSAQLLLAWLRERFHQEQFSFTSNAEKLACVVGTSPVTQISFDLKSSDEHGVFIALLANSLIRLQEKVANLTQNSVNAIRESPLVSPPKRRAPGMSAVNPRNRKRMPAKGLAFDEREAGDNDEVEDD